MVAGDFLVITHGARRFTHVDAWRLAQRVQSEGPHVVILNLEHAAETTTSALAGLVKLRGELLRGGRDLRLRGLHGRARSLYEVYRLSAALPEESAS